jgi:hypothetical protein
MKRFVTYMMSLCILLALSNSINAQPSLKGLKEKAKKVVSGDNKDNKNQGSNNATTNQGNQNASTSSGNEEPASPDEGLQKWFDEKYGVIWGSEYNLSITSLERGEIDLEKQIEGAKILDYKNTLKTLKEKKIAVKATLQGFKVNDMKEYEKKFTDVFQSGLKPRINQKIEEAYKNLKQYEGMAANAMIEAKGIMEFVYLIIPDNADVQALKKDVDKSVESILGPYYAKVYTSEFHKQNVGKVLFSDKPIKIGKEDPAQFKTSFGPNDKIYAVAYLNYRFKDHKSGGNTAAYEILVDENNAGGLSFRHNEGDELLSYYLIEIIPDPTVAFHNLDPQEFGRILSNLSPRKHTLEIGYGGEYNRNLARGKVDLEYSGFDGAKIKANNDLAAKNAQDNWAKNMKLPEEFSKPNIPFKDPELSVDKIKAQILASSHFKDKVAQIINVKVLGTAEDWMIYKNSIDIPTHKATGKYIGFVYKGKDGWCYFCETIAFVRDYEGAGKYTKAVLANMDYRSVKIHCDNVK